MDINTIAKGLLTMSIFQAIDNHPNVESLLFKDDGTFPNNEKLPLLLYRQVYTDRSEIDPNQIEAVFNSNGWKSAWRNGLYNFHHYHSTAHETLGIYQGWIKAQFGGPRGTIITAKAGDIIVVPAGVSHMNLDQSSDFKTIGAYPVGQSWDMNYGKPGERPQTDKNILKVPLPTADPALGESGPLLQLWKTSEKPF